MKTTIKEQTDRTKELMGVVKESKDDSVNKTLATAFATIMAADKELAASFSDWVKNNAKTTSVVLNHNVITPVGPGQIVPLTKSKGMQK
jgi:hypothetical protein